jgi:DUF1365 family protein
MNVLDLVVLSGALYNPIEIYFFDPFKMNLYMIVWIFRGTYNWKSKM